MNDHAQLLREAADHFRNTPPWPELWERVAEFLDSQADAAEWGDVMGTNLNTDMVGLVCNLAYDLAPVPPGGE